MATSGAELFSPELIAIGAEGIAKSIETSGVFTLEGALLPDTVDKITGEIAPMEITVNLNSVAPVFTETQIFFTNFLAKSKTAYDVVTSDLTLDVCDRLMGSYAVAGKRIYTTKVGMNMQWHCDVEKECIDPKDVDATVFIFYLTDVSEGPWQYVDKSHMLGQNFVGGKEMDKVVEEKFRNEIRSVLGRRGTMIVYNGRTFHRAKPMPAGAPPRTSLFYQINKGLTAGEPMLLDAAFLDNLDERRRKLLGVGNPSKAPIFPRTALKSLAIKDLVRLHQHIGRIIEQKSEARRDATAPAPAPAAQEH